MIIIPIEIFLKKEDHGALGKGGSIKQLYVTHIPWPTPREQLRSGRRWKPCCRSCLQLQYVRSLCHTPCYSPASERATAEAVMWCGAVCGSTVGMICDQW